MNTKAYITIIIASTIVFLIIFLIVMRIRKNRAYGREFDLLEGHEFEYYCADLLMKRGFQEVEVTRGSGDYGIDILAERDGVTYAIHSK